MEDLATLVFALVVLIALWAGLVAWRRRREWLYAYRRRFGTGVPSHAVVLVHGLMGFDVLATHEYFRGVRLHLQAAGIEA